MQQPFTTPNVPNNSGQGSGAGIPEEIRGWNWGAFFLTWIWGMGNNVWIALLSLVPIVNIIMHFILGAQGNKWAWQNKSWNSFAHFKKTQDTWAVWGFIIGIPIILTFMAIVMVNAVLFVAKGPNESACTELNNVRTATIAYMYEQGHVPPNMEAIDQYLVSKPLKGTYIIDSKGTVIQQSFGAYPPCNGAITPVPPEVPPTPPVITSPIDTGPRIIYFETTSNNLTEKWVSATLSWKVTGTDCVVYLITERPSEGYYSAITWSNYGTLDVTPPSTTKYTLRVYGITPDSNLGSVKDEKSITITVKPNLYETPPASHILP